MNSSPLPANTAGHRLWLPPAPPQPECSLVEHPAPPRLHTPIPGQGLLRSFLLSLSVLLRPELGETLQPPPAHPKRCWLSCGRAGDAPRWGRSLRAGQHPPSSSHALPHTQEMSPCSQNPSCPVPLLSELSFPSTSLSLGLELAPSTSYVLGKRWKKFLC